MEVYQSTKTAAEMEYALSAVPSIGENGNWFIGDQDTGIFAAGVDVTGAEVGQIVKIAAVDENGRPTAWEPVPISQEWRLLYERASTTVAEGIVKIEENVGSLKDTSEFMLVVSIGMTTLTTECSGRTNFNLDGANLFYSHPSRNYASATLELVQHGYWGTGRSTLVTTQNVSLEYNSASVIGYGSLGNKQGTGVLSITLPAEWAGTYSFKIFVK